MLLKLLISLPILGIITLKFTEKKENWGRIQGIIFSILTMYLSLYLLLINNNNNGEFQYRDQIDLGYLEITLGLDGISLSLIILTTILIPIIILLRERKELEEENRIVKIILIIESMLLLLFSSLDLFTFFILFELLLIPMFILIGRYGSKEKRIEAGYRFIIYSLLGSLIMLLLIITLYLKYGTTNNELLIIKLSNLDELFILKVLSLAFFISFAIKVPVFPFHTWLPFVHVEAPTIGSMLLAGIMLKLGTYGIVRYNINLFGEINNYILPIVIILTILSIVYSSLTTIIQIDLKKIIAYSSIVHLNYAVLGLFTNEIEGLIGSNYMMISHGFVSCGLFLLVGILYKRYHSRIILYYNGLILTMPIFGTLFLLLTFANMSLPLTSSFISEILIIISTVKVNFIIGIIIAFSLLFSTTYGIWLANRLLFGDLSKYINIYLDLTRKEVIAMLPFLIITIILGINSKILFNIYSFPVLNLLY